jgi:hypothetical protein
MLVGVSAAGNVASEIVSKLPDMKRGSLRVFGDIFGGRVDNIHSVKAAARAGGRPERLVIAFDQGETLEVWDPEVDRLRTDRVASPYRHRGAVLPQVEVPAGR